MYRIWNIADNYDVLGRVGDDDSICYMLKTFSSEIGIVENKDIRANMFCFLLFLVAVT